MKLFKKESKIEKEEYFSFCVEGIYKHKNGELFVLGIVDGIIQKLDSLFLIGPYGYEEKVEIQEWIEVDSKQNYYALLIDQRFQEEIDQGYIFTNKNNHLATSREEVYNPYLQFLLDQVNRQHYDYLDILFEQLATRAYFLAVFDYQDFPIYQINDKKYYPIYTHVRPKLRMPYRSWHTNRRYGPIRHGGFLRNTIHVHVRPEPYRY